MQISSAEFASKYNSKRECYTFLALTVKAYLPDYSNVTIYFLKDLISGKRRHIKQKDI